MFCSTIPCCARTAGDDGHTGNHNHSRSRSGTGSDDGGGARATNSMVPAVLAEAPSPRRPAGVTQCSFGLVGDESGAGGHVELDQATGPSPTTGRPTAAHPLSRPPDSDAAPSSGPRRVRHGGPDPPTGPVANTMQTRTRSVVTVGDQWNAAPSDDHDVGSSASPAEAALDGRDGVDGAGIVTSDSGSHRFPARVHFPPLPGLSPTQVDTSKRQCPWPQRDDSGCSSCFPLFPVTEPGVGQVAAAVVP